MKVTIYTDGGCQPTNPGHGGLACVVVPERGQEVHVARYLGLNVSNNVAEYKALIVGVKLAADIAGANYLIVVTDSQLVMNQVNGDWKIKQDHLRPLVHEARALLQKHFEDNWHIEWCKGHGTNVKNNLADKLCGQVIKQGIRDWRRSNPWTARARK